MMKGKTKVLGVLFVQCRLNSYFQFLAEKEKHPQQTKLRPQVQATIPEHFLPSPINDLPRDVKNQITEEVPQKKQQGRRRNLENKPNTPPANEGLKPSKKRTVWDVEDDDEWRDNEERPVKRGRQEPAVVGPKNARTYQAKKYGRKGRNSSPAHSVAHTVDFDEVPGPKQEVALPPRPKPRASAMKPKTGKSAPTAKPAPAKRADEKTREKHPRVAKETASRKVQGDPDITLVNPNDVALDSVCFPCHILRKVRPPMLDSRSSSSKKLIQRILAEQRGLLPTKLAIKLSQSLDVLQNNNLGNL
jgi:hypothetical protein